MRCKQVRLVLHCARNIHYNIYSEIKHIVHDSTCTKPAHYMMTHAKEKKELARTIVMTNDMQNIYNGYYVA